MKAYNTDFYFHGFLKFLSWALIGLFLYMIGLIFYMSWPAFSKFGFSFFISADWNSVKESYGALTLIYGTLITSLIALLIAVPISVGVALFLNELAPKWLAKPLSFILEMLAAIPSIVYGLWGIFVLAPFLKKYVQSFLSEHFSYIVLFSGPYFGVGMLCAGVILAIMIIPTISSICKEVFASIPNSHREAVLGIGAMKWEVLKVAVLKGGLFGILGAIILGLGRALGETMAVTMVIGNFPSLSASLFAPAQTLSSILANQYAEADNDMHLSALTAVGFSLFVISLIVNGFVYFLIRKLEKKFYGRIK